MINKRTVNPLLIVISRPENADAAFTALADGWSKLLGKLHVATPDDDINLPHGQHLNAYQNMTISTCRALHPILKAVLPRHGFRPNQDLLGVVYMIPARTRTHSRPGCYNRLKNGGAFH